MIEEARRTTKGLIEKLNLGHVAECENRLFTNVPVHRHLVQDVGEPLHRLKEKMSKVKKIEVEFHE